MATTIDAKPAVSGAPRESGAETESRAWRQIKRVLGPLASLKLTVVLFAMSILIVLAGTLAQVNADIDSANTFTANTKGDVYKQP